MTTTRLPRSRGLLVIGVVLALTLLGAVALQARQLQLAAQALQGANGFWAPTVFQIETEYLRLRNEWQRALEGGLTPEQRQALQLRYEIWVSRVQLARIPTLRRLMRGEAAYDAAARQLETFVADADRRIGSGGLAAAPPTLLRELAAPLAALAGPTHALTLAAGNRLAERADASNGALKRQSQLGIALTVSLAALCAIFAGLAMRKMRQLEQRSASLEDLTHQLHEARARAVAASESKTVFLANMSHEIRTPFQGVLGMLSLLKDAPLAPRQAEHLRLASESADHLLAILNDILDLSQLEAGQLTLTPAPLDARALLRQVQALMQPLASAKALTLHVDAEPAVPALIVGDATRIRQVLFNLLSNAIKFCPRGSVSLDLRLHAGPPERLCCYVTDTGFGFGAEAGERLFRRYQAGDGMAQGSGLGLEISRNLARLMGGELDVHSVPGEGTRFRFQLPLVRTAEPLPRLAPVAAADLPDRTLRVLVAEDHPVNRQYLASLLENMEHVAHFVDNGRAAVQAVQQQRFDLVLMDLHMPELDGIGATEAIRALAERDAATVPIVALTADAFPATRERCLLAGMNDFLGKPVRGPDLAAALRRLFGQDAAAPAAAPARALVASSAGAPLIDRQAFAHAAAEIAPATLHRLIEDFLEHAGSTAGQMRAAVRQGQPLELRALAHSTRGAALHLGLEALAETARALHEGAAHLPAHEVAHLVQQFETQIAQTRNALAASGAPA